MTSARVAPAKPRQGMAMYREPDTAITKPIASRHAQYAIRTPSGVPCSCSDS